ncbi:MAG: hypothetical protein AAF065_14330 [Verrucomicrobiota bacterium]
MNNILEDIARENFRSSGYITHPSRERRVPWSFTKLPKSPLFTTDTVRDAIRRRERALHREKQSSSLFHSFLNVLFDR